MSYGFNDTEIKEIRADTRGIDKSIHLLAAGAALQPKPVMDEVIRFLKLEEDYGGYQAFEQEQDKLNAVYNSAAQLINAKPEEIAIVENATVGWMHAFYAIPFQEGNVILTCEAEYAANYVAFLQRAKKENLEIKVVPSDCHGQIDVQRMESMIDDRVKLIAMTWIPTNGGLVNPAKQVGNIAQKHGIPYLLDACQAVGQMLIDVENLKCDFLSATGRKFLRGPRGTGFLYIKSKHLKSMEPVMIDHFSAPWVTEDQYELRPDAKRFETWENPYALRSGLNVAINYALNVGLERIQQRAWGLANDLRDILSKIPNCDVRDIGVEKGAIVSFTLEGHDPLQVKEYLRSQGIIVSVSNPSSTLIDATKRSLPSVLRAAPHYYNTHEELQKIGDALRHTPN